MNKSNLSILPNDKKLNIFTAVLIFAGMVIAICLVFFFIQLFSARSKSITPTVYNAKQIGATESSVLLVWSNSEAAKEFIVIVDESKVVNELGTFPVPVEVIPDASRVVIKELEDMGAECEIRMAQRKDGPVITDNGNFVIDAKFSKIDSPQHLEIDLNTIPGVVENGIFSQMVDRVIVGTSVGTKEL